MTRRGLRGFTTPETGFFCFYDPGGKSLKLPALRAEVREPGRSRPRLFLPAFFSSSVPWWKKPPKRGLIPSVGVGGLPQPAGGHTGPHSGPHGAFIRCPAFNPSAFRSRPHFYVPEGVPESDPPCRQSTWTYCRAAFLSDQTQLGKSSPMFLSLIHI